MRRKRKRQPTCISDFGKLVSLEYDACSEGRMHARLLELGMLTKNEIIGANIASISLGSEYSP